MCLSACKRGLKQIPVTFSAKSMRRSNLMQFVVTEEVNDIQSSQMVIQGGMPIPAIQPNVVFLYELKIDSLPRIQNIVHSLNLDKLHVSLAKGASSGIVLFWKNTVTLEIVTFTDYQISALVMNDPTSDTWLLTGVYGPTKSVLKPDFWDDLKVIGQNFNGAWVIAGDFNAIWDQKDKLGGKPFTSGSTC